MVHNLFRQFTVRRILSIRILAFMMTLLCGYINATIFLRFEYGGTHQTGNISKIALSILSLDFYTCLGLIGVVCSFFCGAFISGIINHEAFLKLKRSFGILLLIGGIGLWVLNFIFKESHILNYYCGFYAGIQNGFLTHNKIKLRASHVSGCITDAGFYFAGICRGDTMHFERFILDIANILLFFLGVFIGGFLFLHVHDYVYLILSVLYIGVSIYYFILVRLFFSHTIYLKIL